MRKNIYFLLSILTLIILATGLVFYDLTPETKSNSNNIIFKKDGVVLVQNMPNKVSGSSDFDRLVKSQTKTSRNKVQVSNYTVRTNLEVVRPTVLQGYVSNDLSMMSAVAPRVSVSGNYQAGYKRYISDNSASQAIAAFSMPQALKINMSSLHTHSHGGASGVIETGPMMAVGCDHVFDPLNPGECGNGCGAIPTFPNGWGDGITEDTEIEWVPIGDAIIPMLLCVLMYVLLSLRQRRF
ncbi:MAG: hypothetical protein J6A44_06250 [Paludibacteraceae bacterium]|nr:hypothetical protein [Paludibacteraceae bacterium]